MSFCRVYVNFVYFTYSSSTLKLKLCLECWISRSWMEARTTSAHMDQRKWGCNSVTFCIPPHKKLVYILLKAFCLSFTSFKYGKHFTVIFMLDLMICLSTPDISVTEPMPISFLSFRVGKMWTTNHLLQDVCELGIRFLQKLCLLIM